MDEVLKWLAGLALTALFGVIAFFQKRNLNRMDIFDERLRSAVSTEQLNEVAALIREEIQTKDESKSEWLGRLCDRLDRLTDALTETTKEHNRSMQKLLELILTRQDKL